jgi:trk system potassium uptake protein TrkA
MTFPGNCGLEELSAPSEWIDKTLGDLQLSSRFGLQVLLIKCGERIETTPAPDTKIQDGAVLVLFGENRKLTQFERSQLS